MKARPDPQSETGSPPGEPASANPRQNRAIDGSILVQFLPSDKVFSTLAAKLAMRGHTLIAKPQQGGTTVWCAGKWGQTRVFSHWNDVLAFCTQIGA
jgi:hypothetical protein